MIETAVIEAGDKVRILATETQLAEIGIGAYTRNWLINGCDKEVANVKIENERTLVYLKDRNDQTPILWVYAEMVQVTKPRKTG
jgi:hypothetical protein